MAGTMTVIVIVFVIIVIIEITMRMLNTDTSHAKWAYAGMFRIHYKNSTKTMFLVVKSYKMWVLEGGSIYMYIDMLPPQLMYLYICQSIRPSIHPYLSSHGLNGFCVLGLFQMLSVEDTRPSLRAAPRQRECTCNRDYLELYLELAA